MWARDHNIDKLYSRLARRYLRTSMTPSTLNRLALMARERDWKYRGVPLEEENEIYS